MHLDHSNCYNLTETVLFIMSRYFTTELKIRPFEYTQSESLFSAYYGVDHLIQ